MPFDDLPFQSLAPGARRLVEMVLQRQPNDSAPGINHWLIVLLERHAPMASALSPGLQPGAVHEEAVRKLTEGNAGSPLDSRQAVQTALQRAIARGRTDANERDIAAIILSAAGYPVTGEAAPAPAMGTTDSRDTAPGSINPATSSRASQSTPTLDKFGRDLTQQAREGKLSAFVGRATEIQLVVETLCRRTKRNPMLVGPAGVGKTAIVEGLAQRIVRGEAPPNLQGVRLIAVQPSILVAGAVYRGEFDERMKNVIAEASQDGVLLFIDEAHSMIGAGGQPGTSDLASLLKPALARGDLSCIAATTDEEYRRYIEPDAALERRFQPIRVQELNAEESLQVLKATRDELSALRGVKVDDTVLEWLIQFADQFMRNRYFPDKAVDLLEQCVASAVAGGAGIVDRERAETVAERMVGMPLHMEERLSMLKERLLSRGLLTPEDDAILLHRMEVTLRGLDIRPSRPNVVALLTNGAASQAAVLAITIAETLFGAPERVVTIDFCPLTEPFHVSGLLGASPNYVGYGDAIPLHRVVQMPWCVLLCENVHACHPQVREVLQDALQTGVITDGSGKRIYLSDTVVLMTAEIPVSSQRTAGFRASEGVARENIRDAAERLLGDCFVDTADLVCGELAAKDARRVHQQLLEDLCGRYHKQGIELQWDDNLVQWLVRGTTEHGHPRDWERLVDDHLTPLLIPYLPTSGAEHRRLSIRCDGGMLRIEEE